MVTFRVLSVNKTAAQEAEGLSQVWGGNAATRQVGGRGAFPAVLAGVNPEARQTSRAES
jgi:hypothetical protein